MTRLALPHWAGTLAVKAAVFITVMCCGLAAMLGVLVHVSVTDQTVGQARSLALARLADATKAYQAGDTLLPGTQTAVRVYTVEAGRVVQVMANDDAVSGVELAGHSVIIHAPSDLADYEYRFQWTWDPDQKVMLLTHDEMLRLGKHEHRHRHSPSPSATP